MEKHPEAKKYTKKTLLKKNKMLKATHSGEIFIGNTVIPCYVLEDGTRILTQGSVTKSLGFSIFVRVPALIKNNYIKPFISKDLNFFGNSPVNFMLPGVGRPAKGYRATIIPELCDAILEAREKGFLTSRQTNLAKQCELITRSLAKIGIISLIDEATGYQEIRKKDALQKIFDSFISKELAIWTKRFPDEFYDEMFRLKGWSWSSLKRPVVVGMYTNDIVYDRLAPDIVEELKRKNPKDENGNRANKHHQWLTFDTGCESLAKHLHAVIGLMRISKNWKEFNRFLNKSFPKKTLEALNIIDKDNKAPS